MDDPEKMARRWMAYAVKIAQNLARPVSYGDEAGERESDALLGLAMAIRTYRPEKGPFHLWLKVCVRREVLDGIRRRSPRSRNGVERMRAFAQGRECVGWRRDDAEAESYRRGLASRHTHTSDTALAAMRRLAVSEKQKRVAECLASGMTRVEACRAAGVSESLVSLFCREVRREMSDG